MLCGNSKIMDNFLTTNKRVSKKDLMNYLLNADIPDDASLTLKRNGDDFSLFFYWSEGPGAFGQTVVKFEAESKFWKMKENGEL